MLETREDLDRLDDLLRGSSARAGEHLRSIIDDTRTLEARDVVAVLEGMKVISLATVTSAGEPRISALDGHFLHGTWTFTTNGTSLKARHLERRPAVSISYVDGERAAVFAHGRAVRSEEEPGFAETIAHWTAHYGGDPRTWGDDIRFYRFEPQWMVGYAFEREKLRAELGLA